MVAAAAEHYCYVVRIYLSDIELQHDSCTTWNYSFDTPPETFLAACEAAQSHLELNLALNRAIRADVQHCKLNLGWH